MLNNKDFCNSTLSKYLDKKYPEWLAWEPYTIYEMLERDFNIISSESLQAKILAVQTVRITDTWTNDYEVFFNFCLSEDGLPAASDAFPYPTPEQLCWGVKELEKIFNKKITDDEGFDPDTVDPAVASLLINEGFVYTPDPLHFCLDVMENLIDSEHKDLMKNVEKIWKQLKKHENTIDIKNAIENSDKEDPLTVQISRLADCLDFTLEKIKVRSEYDRAYL